MTASTEWKIFALTDYRSVPINWSTVLRSKLSFMCLDISTSLHICAHTHTHTHTDAPFTYMSHPMAPARVFKRHMFQFGKKPGKISLLSLFGSEFSTYYRKVRQQAMCGSQELKRRKRIRKDIIKIYLGFDQRSNLKRYVRDRKLTIYSLRTPGSWKE